MTTKLARNLKKKICRMPPRMFEPLTFGELNEHDRFIFLPLPGNSEKQKGFRAIYTIFIKNTKCKPGVHAHKLKGGLPIPIRDYDTQVIKVE
ncbi:MAG: hypothetical protein A2V69_03605 [Candidatus Portnoybacteria bacterium RBG_13_40_8]|uniref:Uncharacterized protein n=1 Tax=Candidatus Portnoybacteria bacterium RBG_13_40_8 TaxID=1801990 RepID=A0A1G2F1K5_9BACT|nr:MAG: hypothetical protein A2V69_03605 [Candidatus Portnoybacteria bacterium RBG_13_40_8]